jgi:uncharacterized protein
MNTDHVRIPLADGASLAARVVTPDGDGPFPALVTFYPYRKDDFIGAGEAYSSAYYANAGYASVLIDNRGYGGSTGRAYQPWDPREFDDGVEALAWIAEQPWSNGTFGLAGSSYGGHMSLGVASRRPPGLKAIASFYGAADIYHDFVYPGGCPNALGASAWAALMVALELAPPTLQDPQGAWLEAWRGRLERLSDGEIPALLWPAHRDHDEYWQERVVPVEEIAVPAFFVSGWRDLLCQGMLHAYERCPSEKRLLIGPWSHAAPDMVTEAPYDWHLELRQWWDRWLKDDAGGEARPNVVYWEQGANRWCSADAWPPPSISERHDEPVEERDEYHCAAAVGADAGLWYPMGLQIGAFDQTRDDAKSLCYTTEPLDDDLVIAGAPRAHVEIEASEPVHLTVKVCDVAPDGHSTLVTSGWQRVDESGACDVELYPTAYRIRAGNRLRWTIAGADFPRIWPSPTEPDIAILPSTRFTAPVHVGEETPFDPPLPEPDASRTAQILHAEPICHFVNDEAKQSFSLTVGLAMKISLPQGGTFALENSLTASLRHGQPGSAAVETAAGVTTELATGEVVRAEASCLLRPSRRHLSATLRSGSHTLYEREWSSLDGVVV